MEQLAVKYSNLPGFEQMNIKFGRKITSEQFAALPSELHRIVARHLITAGEWILIAELGDIQVQSVNGDNHLGIKLRRKGMR
jgi:hypothetical protein